MSFAVITCRLSRRSRVAERLRTRGAIKCSGDLWVLGLSYSILYTQWLCVLVDVIKYTVHVRLSVVTFLRRRVTTEKYRGQLTFCRVEIEDHNVNKQTEKISRGYEKRFQPLLW